MLIINKKIFEKIINHFGEKQQVIKAIEELSELTYSLTQYLLGYDYNTEEEIADVKIMVEQLELIFNKNEIDGWYNKKLERIEYRIENLIDEKSDFYGKKDNWD